MDARQVLSKGISLVDAALSEYIAQIREAYLKAEGGLTINMAMKIEPTRDPHVVSLETSVSFVESKVKAGSKVQIDDRQGELFKAVEKLRPKEGSVTISGAGQSVTLKAKTAGKGAKEKDGEA